MNYLLVDCDGCLLDFDRAFNQYAKRIGIKEKPLGIHTRIAYNLTKKEQYDWLREFTKEPEFSEMRTISGSYQALSWFKDQGYFNIVITNWDYPNRYHNLKAQFGNTIDAVHLNGFGNSKKEFLSRFKPTIFIEDDPKKAVEGLECGHTCFLLKTDINHGDCPSGIKLVNNWFEIIDIVSNT